ncbi:MAG TPA: amidase family protein [Vicinamibacterales bacterium]|nr:amidase family protein [Vicinamibacterales bacterium]
MRILRGLLVAVMAAGMGVSQLSAVTRVPSGDGQFWDIQDTSPWAQDSGGIATGGRSNPFNGFGYLKLQVKRGNGSMLLRNQYLKGFGLHHDGAGRFDSTTPVLAEGILVARGVTTSKDSAHLRYLDTFMNTSDEERIVQVAWGGAAGAFEDGGRVAVAGSSSGDRRADRNDAYVTVMQNAKSVADPSQGPSGHGPSAHVLGSRTGVLTSVGDMYGDPFADAWPGYDPAHIGYVFTLRLRPGETRALMTFVVKGLSEIYDPRGGYPIPFKDALVTGEAVYAGADAKIPAAGSEIRRVSEIAAQLVKQPDVRGLTPLQVSQIANWQLPAASTSPFTVFEKTVAELQEAMSSGLTTSEDITREYLSRLSRFDRHGPAFRSVLSINPRAIADARQRDVERSQRRIRSPFHGVPVVYKDNIDAIELPTTSGSLALLDHRPRLDSRVAAGMKWGGAVVLGKANLDEFPFGDFGISTVGGTVGNAYDPSLSTAGSSGGSATSVAASLAALGFGTDTCNSLSNPGSFASLATIRVTRGLVSRAGVQPLNTYNDAVGPMAKSVRDVALALDLVAGVDAEDAVTVDAAQHISGSFAAGLDAATLKGKRIGALRQRFVGFTGEREVAANMDRVIKELQAAGAIVIDVQIPDYDAKYAAARGSAPGSLRAGWTAYLARGSKPGEKVLTIQDLLASGKLAPVSARRFEGALAPVPEGAELEAATSRFMKGRETFRQIFVDLMNHQKLDALLYPANHARPHTHEGGLERYGSEPGTCEESAATGLPQVTVPAGFVGGRYPVGISLLGRMWDDKRLLELAAAYEKATRHRRPPTTVKP